MKEMIKIIHEQTDGDPIKGSKISLINKIKTTTKQKHSTNNVQTIRLRCRRRHRRRLIRSQAPARRQLPGQR